MDIRAIACALATHLQDRRAFVFSFDGDRLVIRENVSHRPRLFQNEREDLDLLSSAQEEIDRHARRNGHLRETIVEVKTTKELEREEDVLDRIPRDIGPIRSRAAELLEDLVGREVQLRLASQKLLGDVVQRIRIELMVATHQLHEIEVQDARHLDERVGVLTIRAGIELPRPRLACSFGTSPEPREVDALRAEIVRQNADAAQNVLPIEAPGIPPDHDIDMLLLENLDPFREEVLLRRDRNDFDAIDSVRVVEAHDDGAVRLCCVEFLERARHLNNGVFLDLRRREVAVV